MIHFGLSRLVHDGRPTLAAAVEDIVHPLPRLIGEPAPASFEDALADWDAVVEAVAAALDAGPAADTAVAASGVEFLPPTVARPAVWCAGANYTDHIAEMGAPPVVDKRAFHFLSPPTVLGGHRAPVVRPTGAIKLDWEIELAAVIGRTVRHVAPEEALSFVAGYTIANDVSVRDEDWLRHPIFGIDWTSSKNADGLTPLGPAVVPARFVPDPADLDLRLSVNGEVRQDSTTSRMIVDLREQIAALSGLVTLRPGDVILTGTPAGTAAAHGGVYLANGDVMIATINGIGTLENTIG